MKVLTAAQMREVDRRTIESGIPGIILMENAGCRVVEFLERTFAPLVLEKTEPLTATDAAGKTTTYTYRSDGHGQLQSVQNAKGETTTYGYGPVTGVPTDYLASVTSPTFNNSSAVTSLTYDSANQVRTVTSSPDNYTVTTDYDALDRTTQISYPDGTNQQFQYTDSVRGMTLDLTASKDRRGHWTYRHYNSKPADGFNYRSVESPDALWLVRLRITDQHYRSTWQGDRLRSRSAKPSRIEAVC